MKEALDAIRRAAPRRVVVFTGAGVSVDSGIPTFRGDGGLWRNFRAEDLATPEAFARDPQLVWEWYEWRRGLVRAAEPNAAHRAIARLEDALVVTQNVDGLHERAGSRNVIELHGNLFRERCTTPHPPLRGTLSRTRERDADAPASFAREAGEGAAKRRMRALPTCECGALLRPDVVWFGEMLPREALFAAVEAIRQAELILVIGTSGIVYPAAGLLSDYRGLSIEINPQPSNIACTYAIAAKAAESTPPIVDAILEARHD